MCSTIETITFLVVSLIFTHAKRVELNLSCGAAFVLLLLLLQARQTEALAAAVTHRASCDDCDTRLHIHTGHAEYERKSARLELAERVKW